MRLIQPDDMPAPAGHYSPATLHNGTVYVSGQLPMHNGAPVEGGIVEQTRLCLEKIETILRAAGSDRTQVLKLNVFISNGDDWGSVNQIVADFFGTHRPARAIIPVSPLHYGCLVEIDCIAAQR